MRQLSDGGGESGHSRLGVEGSRGRADEGGAGNGKRGGEAGNG